MEKLKSIVEHGVPKPEKMKIVKVMRGTSFLNYRDGLEKHGMKVEFETSPYPYYRITHRKWGKNSSGKERAIYITNKRNAGDDAEYISNDNIAMGELTEAKDSRPDFIRKWHQKTANKKADLSKIRTKTMMDLYMVMKNNPKTKKEKDAVWKLFDELKKRGELKHIKSPMDESDEVNEEMYDCIRDYQGMGYSYSEAVKKCKGSGWTGDERGGKKGKRFKREGKEDTTMKITKERLKEIVYEELAELKSFPKSSKALKGKDIVWRIKNSHEKGYKDFFGKKTLDAIAKKSKLTAKQLDQMLPDHVPGNLIYNLWNKDEVSEAKINEGLSDLEFVIDQLSNSMEHYDEKEFVSHLSKETKYNASQLKKVFKAYWKLGAMERNDMFLGGDPKSWLKKLGIR